MDNARWLDGTVKYILVELGMFGNYNNNSDFSCDSYPILSFSFSRQENLLMETSS